MKTKFFLLSWLFAIVPLAFMSCSDDDDAVDATLEVSATDVSFTNAGGEQSVTVTTDQDKWIASSPLESSWLTLTQNGDQLVLKADANTAGSDLKGYVLVNAGNATAKINVMQSAGDVILNLSAEAVSFKEEGGTQQIDVVCNRTFNVEVDEAAKEWLTVTYMEGTGHFSVTAAPNAADTRVGKIFVSADAAAPKEVEVTQAGQSLFCLPFIGHPSGVAEISKFEKERGSTLVKTPDGLFNQNEFDFVTGNKRFPIVVYACADLFVDYSQALTATADPEVIELLKGEKFKEYMAANGFQAGSADQYIHKEFPYTVAVSFDSKGTASIISNYTPKQDKDYPTFDELPLLAQMEWTAEADMQIHGEKYDKAQAWEEEHGGTLNTELSNLPGFAWYDPAATEKDFMARAYWMYLEEEGAPEDYVGEINAARAIYSNINLAFWQYGGSSFLTKEFTALLSKGGFSYVGSDQGYDFYIKGQNALVFGVVAFRDFADGSPVLDFQTFKMDASVASASILTNMEKRTEFFKFMDERMRKLEEIQPLKRIK